MPDPTTAGVLLVAMPWHWLQTPSLQLGLLQSVLCKAGICTDVRTLAIDYLDHCCAETAGLPATERIDVADYNRVALTVVPDARPYRCPVQVSALLVAVEWSRILASLGE